MPTTTEPPPPPTQLGGHCPRNRLAALCTRAASELVLSSSSRQKSAASKRGWLAAAYSRWTHCSGSGVSGRVGWVVPMRAGTELQSLDATEGPSEDEYDDDEEPGWTERLDAAFGQRWQRLLDLSVPYLGRRWAISALFALTYCTRVYMIQGWYIVTYGLAIYQLSLLIGFLTPQVRAARVAGWEQRGLRCARGEPGGEQTCASGVSVGSAPELPAHSACVVCPRVAWRRRWTPRRRRRRASWRCLWRRTAPSCERSPSSSIGTG